MLSTFGEHGYQTMFSGLPVPSEELEEVEEEFIHPLKAMLHGAIFLATCNAILLLRNVKLPNTSLHYTPLMFSQHIENSSLISLINISQE